MASTPKPAPTEKVILPPARLAPSSAPLPPPDMDVETHQEQASDDHAKHWMRMTPKPKARHTQMSLMIRTPQATTRPKKKKKLLTNFPGTMTGKCWSGTETRKYIGKIVERLSYRVQTPHNINMETSNVVKVVRLHDR